MLLSEPSVVRFLALVHRIRKDVQSRGKSGRNCIKMKVNSQVLNRVSREAVTPEGRAFEGLLLGAFFYGV